MNRVDLLSVFRILCITVVVVMGSGRISAQDLYIGMAEVNITPPVGYPHYRGISTGVSDSLFAKAIYFGQGDEQVVIVECDLLWVSRSLSTDVRQEVVDKTDLSYQNIMIAGTHSHTSPAYYEDIMELNEHRRDPDFEHVQINGMEYAQWLRLRIVKVILQAKENSVPGQLKKGSREIKDLSFNRRYLMADGRVKTNPGFQNPAAIHPTGPIDPEVGMLMITDPEGRTIGSVVNFSLHTDTQGSTEFSGDFPAYLSSALKGTYGQSFISFYGQGACGDLNHYNTKVKKQLTSEQIGNRLADVFRDQEESFKSIGQPFLRAATEIVYVPLQDFTPEELAWALDQR